MVSALVSDGIRRKLRILADAAKYDASCASSGSRRAGQAGSIGNTEGNGICHSYTPDGRCVSLLKILLTNSCVYDCVFCVNRVSSDIPRARFSPAEVASLTMEFYRRNYIEGLFLSSGVVKSPDHTAEEMIEVGRLLREEERFGGYIHFKIVPGTSPELVTRAGRYADRLSANIELPTDADLSRLAPEKSFAAAEGVMGEIRQRLDESAEDKTRSAVAPQFAPAGQSTQLIVGASSSNDATILATTDRLYRQHRLRRIYYTAFSPFPSADPRLPLQAPPLAREHRLYQADWLLRHYGFDVKEIATGPGGNLDLDRDPKEAWALANRGLFPVDVNRAHRQLLLRVPGVGVKAANKMVSSRRHRALRLDDLRRLGVVLKRARPFIVTADPNPSLQELDRLDLASRLRVPQQLSLFEAAGSARTGQL